MAANCIQQNPFDSVATTPAQKSKLHNLLNKSNFNNEFTAVIVEFMHQNIRNASFPEHHLVAD